MGILDDAIYGFKKLIGQIEEEDYETALAKAQDKLELAKKKAEIRKLEYQAEKYEKSYKKGINGAKNPFSIGSFNPIEYRSPEKKSIKRKTKKRSKNKMKINNNNQSDQDQDQEIGFNWGGF